MPLIADIFTSFTPFGAVHLTVGVLILVTSYLVVRRRRRLPTELARLRFDRRLVLIGFALVVINQTAGMWPSRFNLIDSLPFHLCDVVGLIAPIAILGHYRVLRAMLYYWGIGLSTQAIFTPDLLEGLGGFTFWVFWVPHGMIVILAIYDLAIFRYRPNWKDYAIASGTLALFLAIVFPINLWLNVNYMYVNQGQPGQATVVDFLGPWPFRVLLMTFGVLVLFAAMTLPFVIAKRLKRSPNVDEKIPDQCQAPAAKPALADVAPNVVNTPSAGPT